MISQRTLEFVSHLEMCQLRTWRDLTDTERTAALEMGLHEIPQIPLSITLAEDAPWPDPLRFLEWAEEQMLTGNYSPSGN